ncbi:hypothetical protein E2C01_008656 [Portunus trituberculatus]|uniref:Uncharacterized protein n=1 Tax=Portunus trituberculatus TaxID=210409 RepID=A0A5B7D4H1_PORTR|nr:hypothetical protein [Portunus trituberculatus]
MLASATTNGASLPTRSLSSSKAGRSRPGEDVTGSTLEPRDNRLRLWLDLLGVVASGELMAADGERGFLNVTSNQLGGGAAKGEPEMEASARDSFSGTVPTKELQSL